jgi:hypothetical protein
VTATPSRPALIFTSGEAIPEALADLHLAHSGVLLRKPFSPTDLLRAALDPTDPLEEQTG